MLLIHSLILLTNVQLLWQLFFFFLLSLEVNVGVQISAITCCSHLLTFRSPVLEVSGLYCFLLLLFFLVNLVRCLELAKNFNIDTMERLRSVLFSLWQFFFPANLKILWLKCSQHLALSLPLFDSSKN